MGYYIVLKFILSALTVFGIMENPNLRKLSVPAHTTVILQFHIDSSMYELVQVLQLVPVFPGSSKPGKYAPNSTKAHTTTTNPVIYNLHMYFSGYPAN